MRNKHAMSIETATAIGIAFGKWACDDAEQGGTLESQAYYDKWLRHTGRKGFDCVAIEESDVYAALMHEWFGDHVDPRGHVNEPLYDAFFRAMYDSAHDEMIRRGHWKI